MANKRPALWPRWLWRGLAIVTLVLTLLVGTAFGYDLYARARAVSDYPPPGQFVRVNGARMRYLCQGAGEPTPAPEAGFQGGLLDWSPALPALAAHHRVCAFDRLGQGWSDPAPPPRAFSTAADELRSALETLGTSRPVVVGHSLGGALVQVYAARYPVSGVVLVDGLTSDVVDPVVQWLGSYQAFDPLARLGLLRPLGGLPVFPGYPKQVRDQMVALRSRSAALLSGTDEGAVAAQSAGPALRAAEARLDVPLLLIPRNRATCPICPREPTRRR